jgi:hypothetical protein
MTDAAPVDVIRGAVDAARPTDAVVHRDARAATHPIHDASLDSQSDFGPDSTATPDAPVDTAPCPDVVAADAPPDASARPDAAVDAGIDAPCQGARNVFTLQGSSSEFETFTLTNLNAQWGAGSSPVNITATAGSGLSLSLGVDTTYGTTLSPGAYPQGSAQPDGGPTLLLTEDGLGCEPASGDLTILDLTQADGGISSFLSTFTLACEIGPGQTEMVGGCVRYQSEPVSPDASITSPEPGYDAGLGPDAASEGLGPCLGSPQVLYVSGSPVAPTPEMITGAEGDWSAGQNGDVTLTVQAANEWALSVGASYGNSIVVGQTYTDAGYLPSLTTPHFVLVANGVECMSPSGSFTVYDYADTGGSEAMVTRLAVSFRASCVANDGHTGTVVGCAHYVE